MGYLQPPTWLENWLEAANPTTHLHHQGRWINRPAVEDELRRQGFEHRILGDWISRTQLFELGAWACESREGSLTLLWNTLAWSEGRANRNNRRRIRMIAGDRDRFADLLGEAARLSLIDAEGAYARLLHGTRSPEIPTLGAGVFTKYLYFAGGGRAGHRCLMLDRRVADSLRGAGWEGFRKANWSAREYRDYLGLIEDWKGELSERFPRVRGDLIERALWVHGG